MAFSRNTLLLLAQLETRMRNATLRTIDVQYMSMSARYADHVLGIALQAQDAELKALGALLRHDFFGPAGLFPGGRMLWCGIEAEGEAGNADTGSESLDFSAPLPSGEAHAALLSRHPLAQAQRA